MFRTTAHGNATFPMVFIIFLGVCLFAAVTTTLYAGELYRLLVSGLTSEVGQQDQLLNWGSLKDWYEAVIGICVGFAGACVAIWLAFRVKVISEQQLIVTSQQYLNDATANVIEVAKDHQVVDRQIRASKDLAKSVEKLFDTTKRISKRSDKYEVDFDGLEDSLIHEYINEIEYSARNEKNFSAYEEDVAGILDEQIGLCREIFGILVSARRSYTDQDALKLFENRLGDGDILKELRKYLVAYLNYDTDERRLYHSKSLVLAERICALTSDQSSCTNKVEAYILWCAFLLEGMPSCKSEFIKMARGNGHSRFPRTLGLASFWEESVLRNSCSPEKVFVETGMDVFLGFSSFFYDETHYANVRFVPNLVSLAFDLVNPSVSIDQILNDFKVKELENVSVPKHTKESKLRLVEMVLKGRLQEMEQPDDPFFAIAMEAYRPSKSTPPEICDSPDEPIRSRPPRARFRVSAARGQRTISLIRR